MKKTIQVKLEEADVERLKAEAKGKGHSVSSLVRLIIKEFFNPIRGK